jgi:hypothetical protein
MEKYLIAENFQDSGLINNNNVVNFYDLPKALQLMSFEYCAEFLSLHTSKVIYFQWKTSFCIIALS